MPKMFERGGSKYRGIIVRSYKEMEEFDAVVVITANHLGYVEFRLCNMDVRNKEADLECLNRTLLTDPTGTKTRFPVLAGQYGGIRYRLKFPPRFKCNHCVFQVYIILSSLNLT